LGRIQHNDTLWVASTRDYNPISGALSIAASRSGQLQFLNALFVILLVPTFNIAFGWLDPQVKIFTAMRKILAGFLFTAAAIGIMSLAGFLAQGHAAQGDKMSDISPVKLSILWPSIAYIVLTFGEVLLYGTTLELAYAGAPKSMKGFVTACFLVTSALGNFINMVWNPQYGGFPDGRNCPSAARCRPTILRDHGNCSCWRPRSGSCSSAGNSSAARPTRQCSRSSRRRLPRAYAKGTRRRNRRAASARGCRPNSGAACIVGKIRICSPSRARSAASKR